MGYWSGYEITGARSQILDREEEKSNKTNFLLYVVRSFTTRLIVSFVYLLIWHKLFTSWHIEPLGWLRFAFESLESSSSWTESSFEINVLLESSAEAQTPLSDLRAQNSDVEAELFARIRALESQLAHGIPPQLNPGEYESLVRENLDNSINLNHYRNSLSNEFFELQILEFKLTRSTVPNHVERTQTRTYFECFTLQRYSRGGIRLYRV